MTSTPVKFDLQWHDIWAAFSLLTRLPVPVNHTRAGTRGAGSAWAFPVVGLVIGGVAGTLTMLSQWLGLPNTIAAISALAFLAIVTGGMHEDGLADFADGLGGSTLDRRLEIMKDSRIGAYGVIALVLAIIARWSGIIELSGWTIIAVLAAIGATSRATMVFLMYAMRPAKKSGLSAGVGQPELSVVLISAAIGLVSCVFLTGLSGVILFALIYTGVLPVYWIANKLLGGQTGDVLGAAQQIAEITGLATAIALLA